jgi:hypothetical protein
VKRVEAGGVTGWYSEPAHRHLPRRALRHLGVPSADEPFCLTVEMEPFFADTALAAARLRDVLRDHGAAEACIHSTWLNRVEKRGPRAERWLDAVGGHEWWPKDVTWRFSASDLRVLAYSDPDFETTTLYAWGQKGRAVLDNVALAWNEVPKTASSEG